MISPDLTRLASRLTAAVSPLTAVQTQATPPGRPAAWSIQQIVEHLLLSYQVTCVTFTARLEKAAPTRATPSISQRIGQFALLNLGYFPRGRKAPVMVFPSATPIPLPGPGLTSTLHAEITHMDTLIAQAETLFGPRTQAVSHQVLGPLSSRQWTRFHLVHGLHHLKQIEAIRIN